MAPISFTKSISFCRSIVNYSTESCSLEDAHSEGKRQKAKGKKAPRSLLPFTFYLLPLGQTLLNGRAEELMHELVDRARLGDRGPTIFANAE
jgi:hypothetical protein